MVNASGRRRKISLAVLIAFMAVWIAALIGMVYGLVGLADMDLRPEVRRYVTRLAVFGLGVVILSGLLLAGWIFHYLRLSIFPPADKPKPTEYVDAWAEAGRRLRPEDAPPVEPYEQPDEQ